MPYIRLHDYFLDGGIAVSINDYSYSCGAMWKMKHTKGKISKLKIIVWGGGQTLFFWKSKISTKENLVIYIV